MKKKSNKIKKWFSRNRTKVLFVGGCVAAVVICGAVAYANRDAITPKMKDTIDKIRELLNKRVTDKSVLDTSKNSFSINASRDTVKQPINGGLPFPVKGHPRTLPENQHASPERRVAAQVAGVTLKENQTWVNDYVKNAA